MSFTGLKTHKLKLSLLGLFLIALSSTAFRAPDIYFEIQRAFSIWSDVFTEISLRYVDEVDPAFLMRTGIDAMLQTLDPYTVLIDESETRELDLITRGTYAGVGLEVRRKDGFFTVIHVMEGYSAFKAGIRPGDIIVAIDDFRLDELAPDEVNTLMLGDAGSEVSLLIQTPDKQQPREVKLLRERIVVGNISFADWIDQDMGLAYIHLSRFSPRAASDIADKIQEYQQENALKALILDMRNNPGGLLNEAVEIVDLFVEADIEVVRINGRVMEMNESYKTSNDVLFDGPLFILQNESSASASEVVAGSLQDLDRAIIVGQPSYGKGLVQIIRQLSYNTSLKITTSKYLLPSGRSIQSIDYGRDYDGYTMKMDTIRNDFQTKNGRLVQDGKGIDPDILLEEPSYGSFAEAILRQDHLFDFANEYVSELDSTATIDESDIMKQFEAYLKRIDFDFETQAEQYYALMRDELTASGISLSSDLDLALNTELSSQTRSLYEFDKKEIARLLILSVTERLKGDKVRVKRSLELDEWINTVKEWAQNPSQYTNLLQGKI